MSSRNAMVRAVREIAEAGVASTPRESPAARRLDGMRDFYAYVFAELRALVERRREEQNDRRNRGSSWLSR